MLTNSATPDDLIRRPFWRLFGLWLICVLLTLSGAALWERSARLNDLGEQSQRLAALATQRVGQHDAHLTALSAVAIANDGDRSDLFVEVSDAIMRFYPRIKGVIRVPLSEDGAPALRIGVSDVDLENLVADAARVNGAALVILADPHAAARYLLIKRSPNSDAARNAVALIVDAVELLAADDGYWDDLRRMRQLRLPDGMAIVASSPAIESADIQTVLESGTQPFLLETALNLSPATLLPLRRTLFLFVAVTLALIAAVLLRRQGQQLRAAERQAELSGLESRLSHAARVNALGEMASGIAHELTQPLTAILAQSQAARRLSAKGEAENVADILDGVVAQTKRASALLERLRTWTQPQTVPPGEIDLRDAARNVRDLLTHQAKDAGVELTLALPPDRVPLRADRIEMEQVIFNLLRNALDALSQDRQSGQVTVSLKKEAGRAVLDVSDTGPGVPDAIREQLFTPFVTTREDGTGLGLALSQRLVERAEGEIALVDSAEGALFRVTLPLCDRDGEDQA